MTRVHSLTSDDAGYLTKKFQSMVSAGRRHRAQLTLAETDFVIRRPVDIPPHAWGLGFIGQGRHQTRFHCDFPEDRPPEDRCLFRLANNRDWHASHFSVFGRGEAVALHRSLAVDPRPGNSLMTAPTWEHATVEGDFASFAVHTARSLPGSPSSWQNDEHGVYRQIVANGLRGSAFVFAHAQSKEHVLEACAWNGCGRYGVDATGTGYWGAIALPDGTQHETAWGGTFTATACRGGGSGLAEYGFARPAGNSRISYCEHEDVRRLVESVAGYASTNAQPLTVESPRVAFTRLPADGFGVWYLNGGPLVVRGAGVFGEGGTAPPRIYHGSLGGISTVVEGLTFGTPGAVDVYPLVQDRIGRAPSDFAVTGRVKQNLYAGREFGVWPVPSFEREWAQAGPP